MPETKVPKFHFNVAEEPKTFVEESVYIKLLDDYSSLERRLNNVRKALRVREDQMNEIGNLISDLHNLTNQSTSDEET